MDYKFLLERLIAGGSLDFLEMEALMNKIMDGELSHAQIAGVLVALRIKGETIEEISAAARVMREHATKIDSGQLPVVDTCGTGGDGTHTFNISTAAAFIAAGAGVKIAKHGNRSVSSKCGSADVLKQLGVKIDISSDQVSSCIQSVGIGFLFAPSLHPAMKHAIRPRRELGVRTIFNMLGPLTNPAGAKRQLLGVYNKLLAQRFAEVLRNLGSEQALIVHGLDGLDEITTTQKSHVVELKNGEITSFELDPLDYIEEYSKLEDIVGGESPQNAEIIRRVLENVTGPCLDIAILNGAAAIQVSGLATGFSEAVNLAKESVTSGKALQKLEEMIRFTNQ